MPEYAAETPASIRARSRRRRAAITIGALVLVLFFAFWYAYSYYKKSGDVIAGRTPAPTCAPYNPRVATPETTTVNVYNSTSREGLAASVSKSMDKRGFTIGAVANDPLRRTVAGPAEVRYGPKGKPFADLVLKSVGAGAKGVQDKRLTTDVDLVLGQAFKILAPEIKRTGLPMCPAPTPGPAPSRSATKPTAKTPPTATPKKS